MDRDFLRRKFMKFRKTLDTLREIELRFNPNGIFHIPLSPRSYSIKFGKERKSVYVSAGHALHTEKSFRNLIKTNRNQIEFTTFRLIWNQTDDRLVPNQSENCKYNLISVCSNNILK